MDISRIPDGLDDGLDAARGFLHATMLSLPMWGLVVAVWYLLTSEGS